MTDKIRERTLAGDSMATEETNNYIKIRGIVKEAFFYSHEYNGKPYYKSHIWVERESGEGYDTIPILVPQRVLKCNMKYEFVEVTGKLCSYDLHPRKGEHHLNVFFSADTISSVDRSKGFTNEVYLRGKVCRKILIKTKYTGETFVQFFLVLERKEASWKYYLPCCSYHKLEDFVEGNIKAKTEIIVKGSFHTRKYYSPLNGKKTEIYEIMCKDINVQ